MRQRSAARLPPHEITGLDPAWSRLVTVGDIDGEDRTFHLLDSWSEPPSTTPPALTLLCVHGNPSWSFLWRHVIAQAPPSVRVIALDHMDMGFSERTGVKRTLAQRISDLNQLTKALELTGPVVTLAHDWGGPISLGWALQHLNACEEHVTDSASTGRPWLAGVILTNTAVHQPETAAAPAVIRLIRLPALLKLITVKTRAFISGAVAMSKPSLPDKVGDGFHAPYLHASRREAIADFVADIPLQPSHESAAMLDGIAAGLTKLEHTPVLLLWGPRDRVFNDIYLHDLERRLPHADVHRYPQAAHFVTEDVDVAGAVFSWLSTQIVIDDIQGTGDPAIADKLQNNQSLHTDKASLNGANARRSLADFSQADPAKLAVLEPGGDERSISFGELTKRVEALAAGMAAFGIAPGMRVAVMIMPGVDLSVVVYASWRLGVTLVLVDSGLGRSGMQRALRGARPDYLIGIDKALIAARMLGWPGKRISLTPCSAAKKRALGIVTDVQGLCEQGEDQQALAWPAADAVAAVAFTSGSTGPSKGVVYLHTQIEAQREALMSLYNITADDRLVAAFAPFALYGPTMGISSMVPDMDVTHPSSLSAGTLLASIQRIEATLVFASPAALVNVVATAHSLTEKTLPARAAVRLALSAGAPVRASLLEACSELFPNASLHTPYGMTEVLPVADISLKELKELKDNGSSVPGAVSADDVGVALHAGVCVGFPLQGVEVTIDPLDKHGKPVGSPSQQADVLGEVIVRGDHIRYGYDRLWHTQHLASIPAGVHRTGDIGQLDAHGRLWIGGRLGHVIVTAQGPVAPVACEQHIEHIRGIDMAAVVGVGPAGAQVVVAVVQSTDGTYTVGEASLELIDLVRQHTQAIVDDVAAVQVVRRLPVDRRHNSKVDRTAVAQWATSVLAGDKVKAL